MYCGNCGGIFENGVCTQCNATQNAHNLQNQSFNQQHPNYNSNYNNQPPNPYPMGAPAKNKVVAGLLALFVGLGIYNFYLGHVKKGVAQLCLWIGSSILMFVGMMLFVLGAEYYYQFGEGFGMFVVGGIILGLSSLLMFVLSIWAFVDAIRIFVGAVKDGNGNLLV